MSARRRADLDLAAIRSRVHCSSHSVQLARVFDRRLVGHAVESRQAAAARWLHVMLPLR